jgi:hypothetical protein
MKETPRNESKTAEIIAVAQYRDSSKENGQKLAVRDVMCDDLCLRRSWLLLPVHALAMAFLTNSNSTLV